MTTREALAALAALGVEISYWRLRGLIDRGEVRRPRLNSSLAWDWSEADISAAAQLIREKSGTEAERV